MTSPAEKAPRKRQRLTLVCDNCKRRKIKCDKGNPCNSCVKSNLRDSCSYSANWLTSPSQNGTYSSFVRSEELGPPADINVDGNNVDYAKMEIEILKQKIQRLESLKLKSLASSGLLPESSGTPSFDFKLSESLLPPPAPPSITVNSEGSTVYNTSSPFSNTRLPPINWKPKSREITPNDTDEDHSSSTSDTDLSNEPSESMKPDSFSEPTKQLPKLPTKEANNFILSPFEIITTSNYSPNFLVGINPVANTTETIDFYEHCSIIGNKDPRKTVNYGPFSWSSLMKCDGGLNLLWEYLLEMEASKQLQVFGELSPNKEIAGVIEEPNNEKSSTTTATESKYNKMLKQWIKKSNNSAIDKYQLKNQILAVLPPKRIIWTMVERFFIFLYPSLPFLDQEIFEYQITKIIGSKPPVGFPLQTSIMELNITAKNDFAVLGILLTVMRLSFLSMLNNNEDKNRSLCELPLDSSNEIKRECLENVNYLMENPIGSQSIQLANDCLHLFPSHNTDSLLVLQLAFFIRLCNRFAPEDGDGADGSDAQIANAILIQMSYSLGLNREPSKFESKNPKIENLMRKIWHFNIFADAYQSYTFGNPLTVNQIYYDTKLPFSTDDNSNIKNKNLDKEINKNIRKNFDFLEDIRKVLKLLLNVEAHPKMVEVSEVLSNFETSFFNRLLTFEHCLGLDEEYEKENQRIKSENVNQEDMTDLKLLSLTGVSDYQAFLEANKLHNIKSYISVSSFLVSIYFHLYLHYSSKNHNLSFFYLKKTFLFILEVVPYYHKLLKMSTMTCDFILNPTLLTSIHKSNQIFLSFITKLNFVIYEMKKICREQRDTDRTVRNPNFYQYLNRLENFKDSLVKLSRYLIASVSSLSNRYFYAWKIAKAHSIILESVVLSDEFYEKTYGNPKLFDLKTPRYSSEQVKELQRIVNDAIVKTINYTNNEYRQPYKGCKEVDEKWYNYASDNGKKRICLFDIFNDDNWIKVRDQNTRDAADPWTLIPRLFILIHLDEPPSNYCRI